MEKLILVFYIGVGNLPPAEVSEFMQDVVANLKKDKQKDIIYYFIPVRNQETKIECINPKLVSEDDYKKAKEALDNMNLKLQEIISDLNGK